MKIAILDLTAQKGALFDGLPRVAEQIEAWIAPHFSGAEFTLHDIAHGAEMPGADAFDGVIVSGSEFGVYDETPWMQPLRDLLAATKAAGKPIYGICFGHQIMADVFGGRAEKSEAGYHVGIRQFEDSETEFPAIAWHQDQVTEIPPGAKVTGSAPHCPIGALDYDFPAKSIQYHQEYRETHLRELFARGRDVFITGEKVDEALASFENVQVSQGLAARECAAFFRNALATK